ncbi:hypothetical protein [Halobacillus salinus]|uniref:Uncharacterized protein n=1 Tax=Halobacillus salinus TaxID=192814 RepID=A0A4Z0GUB0_9BACI|nr:hypothetical protein [Halobacillus salinus]TGB01066.1 hypothetical protein E4663_18115 [Halobacillus salinus]
MMRGKGGWETLRFPWAIAEPPRADALWGLGLFSDPTGVSTFPIPPSSKQTTLTHLTDEYHAAISKWSGDINQIGLVIDQVRKAIHHV